MPLFDIHSFINNVIKVKFYKKIFESRRIKNVVLSGISNFSIKAFSILINLISVPLTLNYLGKEKFGVWLTITSTISLFNFLDFGLGSGLVNQISEARGKGNSLLIKKSITTSVFLLIAITIFISSLYICFKDFCINNLYSSLNSSERNEAQNSINILIIFILLNIPLGLIQRIYDGLQLGYKFTTISLLGVFLNLIFLITAIHNHGGLEYLVLSINLGTLISVIIAGIYLIKDCDLFEVRFGYFDRKLTPQILKQGFLFFIMTVFTIAAYTTDNFIIAEKLNFSQVTKFDLAKKIFSASAISQFFIIPLWPMFNEAISAKNFLWSKKILIRITVIALSASLFFSLPLLIWGNQIVYYWTKQQQDIPFSVLLGFYFFILLSTAGGIVSSFFSGKRFLIINTILIIISSIFSVTLKIILVDKLGISIIIWATVISYLICYILPSYFIIRVYFRDVLIGNENRILKSIV